MNPIFNYLTTSDTKAHKMLEQRTTGGASGVAARVKTYSENYDTLTSLVTQLRRTNQAKGINTFSEGLNSQTFLTQDYTSIAVAANLLSYAGFLTIERSTTKDVDVFDYVNTYGLNDNLVVSTLGEIGTQSIGQGKFVNKFDFAGAQASLVGQTAVNINLGIKIAFFSVDLNVTDADGTYQITDNGKGALMSVPGKISSGSIDYETGEFKVEFVNPIQNTWTMTLSYVQNIPATEDMPRLHNRILSVQVGTWPQEVLIENDLMSQVRAQKSIGIDLMEVSRRAVATQQVININNNIIDSLISGYEGNSYVGDLTSLNQIAGDYFTLQSNVDALLIQLDNMLGIKSGVAMNASAYVVGRMMTSVFQQLAVINRFRPNQSQSYVDGLIGWYINGKGLEVPVLTSSRIANDEVYAVAKTPDGQLAPVMRVIQIPPTSIPEVNNFAQPLMNVNGIMSKEGYKMIRPELCVRATIKLNDAVRLQVKTV